MKFTLSVFAICALALASVSCNRTRNVARNTEILEPLNLKTPYFVSVPFTKFSSIKTPCLDVQVGDVTISMELDLGLKRRPYNLNQVARPNSI